MVIRMMYLLPMMLGRTYDSEKNTIGVDIFSPEVVASPKINQESFYSSSVKTIESSADVKNLLDISGALSLNIKAGLLDIKGMGAYVKNANRMENSVDILFKVRFRTISKTLPHTAKPLAEWSTVDREHLGTHFVESIIYGGDLIALIRFKASKVEDLENIRATIKTTVSAGSVFSLVGEGKLEALDKKFQSKATMEISYYATVPLEGVPNTIQGLRELVKNFKDHVQKVNDGIGVAIEVELGELERFDTRLQLIKNIELETELDLFEEYLDDLMKTKSQMQFWLQNLPGSISEEDRKKISDLSDRVRSIRSIFDQTIANLDLQKGSRQLDKAKAAYMENKGRVGKFRRELNKLMKKIVAIPDFGDVRSTVYTHYGSKSCIQNDTATTTLYTGHVASSPRLSRGYGVNYLCMTKDPRYDEEDELLQNKKGGLAGVKYGMLQTKPFPVRDDEVPLMGVLCSVCLVNRQTVTTFYGATSCPKDSGWTEQYSGYVMATTDVWRGENICVDAELRADRDGYKGDNDQSLSFAALQDDILHSDFIVLQTHFLPCVVCSK